MKDPELFLDDLGVELASVMDGGEPAVLDPEHRAWINHEVYFFSSPEERSRFLAEPARYCGVVTDPVTGERFRPGEDSPRLDHGGRPFFFLTGESQERFAAMPDSFAVPMGRMRKTSG